MSTTAAASGSKTLLVQYNSNGTQTSASTNASGGTGAEGGGYRIGEVGRIGTGSVSTLSSVSSSSSTTSTTDSIRGVGVGVEVGSVSGSIVLVSTSTTHNPVRANQHHHHHQMNQNLPILKPDLLLNDTGLFTVYCFIKNFIGASGTSAVAIDNKIEQAMDLVKSHLMIAVREEVEVLKEKIAELMDRINTLERENTILKANVSQDILSQLPTAPAKPPQNTNTSNGPVS